MDYQTHFYFLVGKLGKLKLAKELKISFTKFQVLEKDLDKLTITQVTILQTLYNEQLNK